MPVFDVNRSPDHVIAFGPGSTLHLKSDAGGRFGAKGVSLLATPEEGVLRLALHAGIPVTHLRVRWDVAIPEGLRYLCGAWESSDGDLEWRALVPDRQMPWYFLAYDGQRTHGVGVRTGAGAFCHWQVDPYGVDLWMDVRNGSRPVEPGDREVALASVVSRSGHVWELPFESARRFIGELDTGRIMPDQTVYGFALDLSQAGDWTLDQALRQSSLLSDLAENTANRPVCVVGRGLPDRGALRAADMRPGSRIGEIAALAAGIAARGCRPGIWLHPLLSDDPALHPLCLHIEHVAPEGGHRVLDPTHPEAMEMIRQAVTQAPGWGFEFVRYGDTILDLLYADGGHALSHGVPDCHFYDTARTTAEVLGKLYADIHDACGTGITVAGSGTVGHLACGHVHLQRLARSMGYVTWEATRSGPLGALAFRGFHHGALYAAEASPVRLDTGIPWSLNEQWLKLLSGSGTPCFVVPGRQTPSEAEQRAIRTSFGNASRPLPLAEPMDWLVNTCPGRWKLGTELATFDWFSALYD
jgi:alpha-galactosidase